MADEEDDTIDALVDSAVQGADYDFLISWVSKRMAIFGYEDEAKTDDAHSAIISFVTGEGPKTLSICRINEHVVIECDDNGHQVKINGLRAYFIRANASSLSKETIEREVQYGSVNGQSLLALERMMKGLVEKQVSQNQVLTDGARNELTGHYHKVMATLTDVVHFTDGKTILYSPKFDFQNIGEAAMNKDLVQIMESVVIHWTRQN